MAILTEMKSRHTGTFKRQELTKLETSIRNKYMLSLALGGERPGQKQCQSLTTERDRLS